MVHLKVGIVLDRALLNMPFLARVDIAIEPGEIVDFIGLYLNNKLRRREAVRDGRSHCP